MSSATVTPVHCIIIKKGEASGGVCTVARNSSHYTQGQRKGACVYVSTTFSGYDMSITHFLYIAGHFVFFIFEDNHMTSRLPHLISLSL